MSDRSKFHAAEFRRLEITPLYYFYWGGEYRAHGVAATLEKAQESLARIEAGGDLKRFKQAFREWKQREPEEVLTLEEAFLKGKIILG